VAAEFLDSAGAVRRAYRHIQIRNIKSKFQEITRMPTSYIIKRKWNACGRLG